MEALICSVQKQKAYALIVEAAKTGIDISSITSMVALVVLPQVENINNGGFVYDWSFSYSDTETKDCL